MRDSLTRQQLRSDFERKTAVSPLGLLAALGNATSADTAPVATLAEVRRLLKRGVTEQREAELWESLFITRDEVDGVLAVVHAQRLPRFVYPMFVLVAHTGMRRSELLRAERETEESHQATPRSP